MTEQPSNIHGRKPGRGIRPWLLIPKVVAVAVYSGGLTATALLWFSRPNTYDTHPSQSADLVDQISLLFVYLLVPALLAAILFGLCLLIQHAKVYSRLRWWQVTIVVIVLGVPTAHFFMESRLALLREAAAQQTSNVAAERQLSIGFVTLLAGTLLVVVLGRLKPRLGQNWARMHANSTTATKKNTKVRRAYVVALLVVCSALAGCRKPIAMPPKPTVPSDFVLTVNIRGDSGPHEPGRYPSQYIVEPDRRLRAALGAGVSPHYYPKLTRVLTPGQMQSLWEQIERNHLTAEPTSPTAEADLLGTTSAPVLYRVTIISHGRTHRYATTPAESPPTRKLIEQLIDLRAPVIPVPRRPD